MTYDEVATTNPPLLLVIPLAACSKQLFYGTLNQRSYLRNIR